MPTASEVSDLRDALNALSGHAVSDARALWSTLPDPSDLRDVRAVLEPVWPELVSTYAEPGVVIAADMAESWAADVGLRPRVVMVEPVDADRANARMRWAIGAESQIGSVAVLLDELVKQPARSTLAKTAVASGGGWARVPRGAETCAFCLMLGSRGAVYSTSRSAGGRKFHGECDCVVILVRDERDYPEGYDPDGLHDAYSDATVRRGSGAVNMTATLAEMRKDLGIN